MQNFANPHLRIFTNFYLEFFTVGVTFVSNSGRVISQLFSIKIKLNRHLSFLKIKLRRASALYTDAISTPFQGPIRISLDDFLDYLRRQALQKIKISSRGFDFNNLLNLSFLFSLLFYIDSNSEFKLAIKDEDPGFIQPLPALLYAALHDPQRLLRVSLNLFYCQFDQKEVIKILQMIFCEVTRLKKLKFIVNGKDMSLARIMKGVMDSGMTLPETLEKLVLNCRNFESKAIIEWIFGSFRNLECLKIQATLITLDDETLQTLTENGDLAEKLKTLYLSLRNKQITNASLEEFFRVTFEKLEDLKVDFKGSDIDEKAFMSLVKTRFRRWPELKSLKFDFEGTRVPEEFRGVLEFLLKKKLEGSQNGDYESCFRTVIDTLELLGKCNDV